MERFAIRWFTLSGVFAERLRHVELGIERLSLFADDSANVVLGTNPRVIFSGVLGEFRLGNESAHNFDARICKTPVRISPNSRRVVPISIFTKNGYGQLQRIIPQTTFAEGGPRQLKKVMSNSSFAKGYGQLSYLRPPIS